MDQPDAAQLHQLRLSPRLEMRLALNHDIMGDEDLINYEAGPSLTSILGRDLSSYHRVTGKDIIMNRIMNRKDVINNTHCLEGQEGMKSDLKLSSQQNNSKMDTPILNRKASQLTWNNSGFARKGRAFNNLNQLYLIMQSIFTLFGVGCRRKSSFGFGAFGAPGENILYEPAPTAQ